MCLTSCSFFTGLENENGGDKERACDSLLMCFVTMMNHGLRNGGGIGDVLRSPSNTVKLS